MSAEEHESEVSWAYVDAHRTNIPDAETMADVIHLLHGVSPIVSYRGADGAPWIPFSDQDVAADAPALFEAGGAWLRTADGDAGRISVDFRPHVDHRTFGRAVTPTDCRAWLGLADALLDRCRPHRFVVGWGPATERGERGARRWSSSRALRIHLYEIATKAPTRDARRFGPAGLSLRTYLDAHYASLFDRDLLFSTPGKVTAVGDGVVIDVVDDLLAASFDELLDAWWACTEHLRPAEVFAVPEIEERRQRIRYTRSSANFRRPPKPS